MGINVAEIIARIFHERYVEMAPYVGWETQGRTNTEWSYLPDSNRDLMISVVTSLLADQIISIGPNLLANDED